MIPKFHTGMAMAAAVSALLAFAPVASAQQQGPGEQYNQYNQPTNQYNQQNNEQNNQQNEATAPSQFQQIRGEVLDVKPVDIRDVEARNVLALIRTPQGNRAVIDLGDDLHGVNLQQGHELAARGQVVSIGGDRVVLLASAFRYDGSTYDTNRVAAFLNNEPAMQGNSSNHNNEGNQTNEGTYNNGENR